MFFRKSANSESDANAVLARQSDALKKLGQDKGHSPRGRLSDRVNYVTGTDPARNF
jgi:hypothetical protein